jgi:putative transposase
VKRSQKVNPEAELEVVKKQEEIREFIRANPSEIESGRLVVLFLDECHLCWGDVCSYGWGRSDMGRDSHCQ